MQRARWLLLALVLGALSADAFIRPADSTGAAGRAERAANRLAEARLPADPAFAAPANPPPPSPFRIKFREVTTPHPVTGVFVLPGEVLPVEVISEGQAGAFVLEAGAGETVPAGVNRWRWTAPPGTGLYPLRLLDPSRTVSKLLHVFVMAPYARLAGGRLNGYPIGHYPAAAGGGRASYGLPRGFVEVTPENEDALLSPHFRLKQFICKQPQSHPKYIVLREELVLGLETIVEELNQAGHAVATLSVMSGYRTPYYNHAIGNVKHSAHQWGMAADIFVDSDGDDRMDDLTRDGKIDEGDAGVLYRIIDGIQPAAGGKLPPGGLARYEATAAHGPFVHVDVRGVRARWGGV